MKSDTMKSDTMKSDIAVIVPNYNRALMLQRALWSVYRQSYASWRCYIIDDGSTNPEALATADRFCEMDRRFVLVRRNHAGVAAARNAGIIVGAEPWIAMLDSDDAWKPEKLRIYRQYADKHTPRLWHSSEIWIRNGVRIREKKRHRKGGGDQFIRSTELCVISPSAAMLPRSFFCRYGLFDERMPAAEDYDLWLRITAHTEIGYIDLPLTIKYGGHDDQLSRTPLIDQWRIYALRKALSHSGLSPKQRWAVQQSISAKLAILQKGAEKHRNLVVLHWIDECRRSVSLQARQ